jgi:hypothetical protein
MIINYSYKKIAEAFFCLIKDKVVRNLFWDNYKWPKSKANR